MSENFDVVNLNDQTLSQATRMKVHEESLLHRAVHILVLTSGSRWILQQRSKYKDIDPLLWTSSCSGHVDAGEDYIQAAVRECQEELGVRIKYNSLIEVFRSSPCEETGYEFTRFYILKHNDEIKYCLDEILKIKEYSISDIELLIQKKPHLFSNSFKHLFAFVKIKLDYMKLV